MHLAVQRPARHRRLVGRGSGVGTPLSGPRLLPPFGFAPPPPASPQRIQRPVPRDREDPRHQRPALGFVLVDATPHLRERVCHDLLGLVFVLEDSEGEAQHPRRQQVVQLLQRPLVPRLQAPN